MLLLQLYPSFLQTNISVLIHVMMEALSLRPPSWSSIVAHTTSHRSTNASPNATSPSVAAATANAASSSSITNDPQVKRLYVSRARELVAAQAKTLSFITYLLRSFAHELKPFDERLATNVVALMTTCPRESVSTRKELLVATRHLLNHADFRRAFYRHLDALLEERVLLGAHAHHHRFTDPTLIRPLGYTTLADLVSHVRGSLTLSQLSRVVLVFSRVLHDASPSTTLPLSTQYTAVRTLLSVMDSIYHFRGNNNNNNINNNNNTKSSSSTATSTGAVPTVAATTAAAASGLTSAVAAAPTAAAAQIGRDLLVQTLDTLVDKLTALVEYFPVVLQEELERDESTSGTGEGGGGGGSTVAVDDGLASVSAAPPDTIRDVQIMIRAIIVGNKTLIYYINSYRLQREKDKAARDKRGAPPPGPVAATTPTSVAAPPSSSNDEVASALQKMTLTEMEIVDRYILTALAATKLLTEKVAPALYPGPEGSTNSSASPKSLTEQHRDALTYFAAAFTNLDGPTLARTLGRRLDRLVDAICEDSMVMVVPRHLLGANPTTSFEFCTLLLDHLMERMDELAAFREEEEGGIFFDWPSGPEENDTERIRQLLYTVTQRPRDSDERLRQRSSVLLQLFERVLKSLSVYPENEAIVRGHLRKIVSVCLRSSMEQIDVWPDNYCMLLRYVFRSISAGKFEESYKELLPLIPTVLNGLYRIFCTTKNQVVRHTAVELCLTIPARLSSLLPHMNLLVRVIIPALDSNSGDLVNLG